MIVRRVLTSCALRDDDFASRDKLIMPCASRNDDRRGMMIVRHVMMIVRPVSSRALSREPHNYHSLHDAHHCHRRHATRASSRVMHKLYHSSRNAHHHTTRIITHHREIEFPADF
eukprot:1195034-Prorocentrum_minimum.AAC.2